MPLMLPLSPPALVVAAKARTHAPASSLLRRTSSAIALLGFALFAGAPDAGAVPITFAFEGVVASVSGGLSTAAVPITDGAAITGTFTFETTAADTDADPNVGIYPAAAIAMTLDYGGYTASFGSSLGLTIFNETGVFAPANDSFDLVIDPAASGGFDATLVSFQLYGSLVGVFDDDSIPVTPPDPADFFSPTIFIQFPEGTATGSLTSLSLVPEPKRAAILVLVLLAVPMLGRRGL